MALDYLVAFGVIVASIIGAIVIGVAVCYWVHVKHQRKRSAALGGAALSNEQFRT
jgi:putative effector of murein hydrolase